MITKEQLENFNTLRKSVGASCTHISCGNCCFRAVTYFDMKGSARDTKCMHQHLDSVLPTILDAILDNKSICDIQLLIDGVRKTMKLTISGDV